MTRNVVLSLILCVAATILMAYSTGSPKGRTGSPGDNYINCSQCHNGPPQNVSGWITTNIPITGYLPGNTYTVTVTAYQNGATKGGFELCAEDNSNQKRGVLILTDLVRTKLPDANHITHTANGVFCSSGQNTWSFDWEAPAIGTGDITFYSCCFLSSAGQYGGMSYLCNVSVQEMTTGIEEIPLAHIWYDPYNQFLHFTLPDKGDGYDMLKIEYYSLSGQKLGTANIQKTNHTEYLHKVPANHHGMLIVHVEAGRTTYTAKYLMP